MSILSEISSSPLDAIRKELATWDPWPVVITVVVILAFLIFCRNSNK